MQETKLRKGLYEKIVIPSNSEFVAPQSKHVKEKQLKARFDSMDMFYGIMCKKNTFPSTITGKISAKHKLNDMRYLTALSHITKIGINRVGLD